MIEHPIVFYGTLITCGVLLAMYGAIIVVALWRGEEMRKIITTISVLGCFVGVISMVKVLG